MALTGWPDRPPLLAPPGLVDRLDALTASVTSAGWGHRVALDWPSVITGRAAIAGLSRQGRRSANGSCRLLPTADGWVALNLARAADEDLIEALTGIPPGVDPWEGVIEAAAGTSTDRFVSRGRLLGLAIAPLARPEPDVSPWTAERRWPTGLPPSNVRVVNLSSLWAGPLTAAILAAAGAAVVKVESTSRPHPAHLTPEFRRWLSPPAQQVARLDFASEAGRRALRSLVAGADVVIEGSRPRALEQLGASPDAAPNRPGRVWLSITGYGRQPPGRDWVAFGDDAAVAGGLVAWDSDNRPVFCADAIADPVTGLLGAEAVLRSLAAGGGTLIDLALSRGAAHLAASDDWGPPRRQPATRQAPDGTWHLDLDGHQVAVSDPPWPAGLVHPPAGSERAC